MLTWVVSYTQEPREKNETQEKGVGWDWYFLWMKKTLSNHWNWNIMGGERL